MYIIPVNIISNHYDFGQNLLLTESKFSDSKDSIFYIAIVIRNISERKEIWKKKVGRGHSATCVKKITMPNER